MAADDGGGVIMMAAVNGGATTVEAAAVEGGRRLGRAGLLCFCVWEKSAWEQLLSRGRYFLLGPGNLRTVSYGSPGR